MLVCLCSKNNEADVREVFRRRPEMPLTWAHVTSARINWEPKSANLRALAAELDLGLSSFVFIDDSPYEIAEVRHNCPEVLALQLPSDAAAIHRFIAHAWFFDRTAVTDADRLRAASYAQNARRNEIRRQATSLDDFLRDLEHPHRDHRAGGSRAGSCRAADPAHQPVQPLDPAPDDGGAERTALVRLDAGADRRRAGPVRRVRHRGAVAVRDTQRCDPRGYLPAELSRARTARGAPHAGASR